MEECDGLHYGPYRLGCVRSRRPCSHRTTIVRRFSYTSKNVEVANSCQPTRRCLGEAPLQTAPQTRFNSIFPQNWGVCPVSPSLGLTVSVLVLSTPTEVTCLPTLP